MKISQATTIEKLPNEKLPNGIYYHCGRCEAAWVSTPCDRCEFRHGQVMLKVPNTPVPNSSYIAQLSRILDTLMGLILVRK